jgi:hypothetical protein
MDYKMLMRRLKGKNVMLPDRCALLPLEQKMIYEAIYYPKNVDKSWYEDY